MLDKLIKQNTEKFPKDCIYNMSDYPSAQTPASYQGFVVPPQSSLTAPGVASTCAVHGVIIEGLQTKIDKLETGQNELKELIQHNHKETLQSFIESYGKTQDDIGSLRAKLENRIQHLDDEHDRDKDKFTDSMHRLKQDFGDQINKMKVNYALIAGGVGAFSGITMFALQAFGVFSKLF